MQNTLLIDGQERKSFKISSQNKDILRDYVLQLNDNNRVKKSQQSYVEEAQKIEIAPTTNLLLFIKQ